MEITDELRSFIKDPLLGYASQEQHVEQLTAIADRIDAALTERYVELPKDANGEVIHLGDVVMLPDWPLHHHEVINLVYAHDGWAIISRHGSIEASEHTVHVKPKKPTVEDVLREFAEKMNENMGMYTGEAIDADEWRQADSKTIAEYVAKLQLRGDGE